MTTDFKKYSTKVFEKCNRCGAQYIGAVAQTDSISESLSNTRVPETWTIFVCKNPQCQRFNLYVDTRLGWVQYPSGGYYELPEDLDISEELRGDYREAGKCLDVGCYKASMVMSRRALQRILKEQGCEQRGLSKAIEHAIENNILIPAFHGVAREIKEYGDLGAHPDDDQLNNVTKENSSQVIGFVRRLVEYFYELPASVESLSQARKDVVEEKDGEGGSI